MMCAMATGSWSEPLNATHGAVACKLCAVGRFSPSIGRGLQCSLCPKNTYARFEGSTTCM